jgi:hypothetical protein
VNARWLVDGALLGQIFGTKVSTALLISWTCFPLSFSLLACINQEVMRRREAVFVAYAIA